MEVLRKYRRDKLTIAHAPGFCPRSPDWILGLLYIILLLLLPQPYRFLCFLWHQVSNPRRIVRPLAIPRLFRSEVVSSVASDCLSLKQCEQCMHATKGAFDQATQDFQSHQKRLWTSARFVRAKGIVARSKQGGCFSAALGSQGHFT